MAQNYHLIQVRIRQFQRVEDPGLLAHDALSLKRRLELGRDVAAGRSKSPESLKMKRTQRWLNSIKLHVHYLLIFVIS